MQWDVAVYHMKICVLKWDVRILQLKIWQVYVDIAEIDLPEKLSKKTPLNLAEAFQIQQKVFPDKDIYYLFDLEDRQAI